MRELKKLSIIVPVYYNEGSIRATYDDIKKEIIDKESYNCEIIFVDDCSGDNSWDIITQLQKEDSTHVKRIHLSRNFGSQYAVLCGFTRASGDCMVIKAADRQEPIELITNMVKKWQEGYNVVIAEREDRDDSIRTTIFSNLYYKLVRRFAFPNMPKLGFDIFLLDKKACDVICKMDENNSSTICQVLWIGFRSTSVKYHRLERKEGKSRWTFKNKFRLVEDTFYNFSDLPFKVISGLGSLATIVAIIWSIWLIIARALNMINVYGWATIVVLQLLLFGITMMAISIIAGYIWRLFIRTSNRPSFIVEEEYCNNIDMTDMTSSKDNEKVD